MAFELSPDTQAILLLTEPLIAGRGNPEPSVKPLGAGEYRRLARRLRELRRRPSDLLAPGARGIVDECRAGVDPERLERLLGRGFLLAQMEEHWRARAIWVLSRADAGYPRRLKQRLGEDAPPVLYGCGDIGILGGGGLAVVGSRNVPEALIEYTENVGRLAAAAGRGLVSGGARGVDRAAMRGASEAGGHVVGILANGLERAAMLREHRGALMDGRLVLACPYDPASDFRVGHAMGRNKLIYALSDAALVVNSDRGKGGTWTGATEQLDKLRLVPVYVRADGGTGSGLEALRERGAMPWPAPETPEALGGILDTAAKAEHAGAPTGRGHAMREPVTAEPVPRPPGAMPAPGPVAALAAIALGEEDRRAGADRNPSARAGPPPAAERAPERGQFDSRTRGLPEGAAEEVAAVVRSAEAAAAGTFGQGSGARRAAEAFRTEFDRLDRLWRARLDEEWELGATPFEPELDADRDEVLAARRSALELMADHARTCAAALDRGRAGESPAAHVERLFASLGRLSPEGHVLEQDRANLAGRFVSLFRGLGRQAEARLAAAERDRRPDGHRDIEGIRTRVGEARELIRLARAGHRAITGADWQPPVSPERRTGAEWELERLRGDYARDRAEAAAPEGTHLLVCGGRGLGGGDAAKVAAQLDKARAKFPDLVLHHGGAAGGADRLAAEWAAARGVPCIVHSLRSYTERARRARNLSMLEAGPRAVLNFGIGERDATATHLAGAALSRRIPVWNLDARLRTSTAGPEADGGARAVADACNRIAAAWASAEALASAGPDRTPPIWQPGVDRLLPELDRVLASPHLPPARRGGFEAVRAVLRAEAEVRDALGRIVDGGRRLLSEYEGLRKHGHLEEGLRSWRRAAEPTAATVRELLALRSDDPDPDRRADALHVDQRRGDLAALIDRLETAGQGREAGRGARPDAGETKAAAVAPAVRVVRERAASL